MSNKCNAETTQQTNMRFWKLVIKFNPLKKYLYKLGSFGRHQPSPPGVITDFILVCKATICRAYELETERVGMLRKYVYFFIYIGT